MAIFYCLIVENFRTGAIAQNSAKFRAIREHLRVIPNNGIPIGTPNFPALGGGLLPIEFDTVYMTVFRQV